MRKKIIILATYVGVANRGAETFVIELVKKLRSEFDIEVYSLGNNEDIKDQIVEVKIRLPFWFSLHKKLYFSNRVYRIMNDIVFYTIPTVAEQYYFTKTVYRKFLKNRKDISLMFPNNGHHGARLSKLLRQKFQIPYIYTGHGGIGKGEVKILHQKPDTYVALNETHKHWARQYHDRVIKISNGVDSTKFSPNLFPRENKTRTVLCVAAFVQLKRQKLLIDAVSRLDDVNLVLLGEGELREDLLLYGNSKLGIRFSLSSVSYNEIARQYSNCDVFSLPTKEEPFGIVYLEAMSMNKPVVSPDDQSRREILGEAGVFCNVENPDDYAEAINFALENDWTEIPRNRAINHFEWDVISKQYSQLIHRLTNPEI